MLKSTALITAFASCVLFPLAATESQCSSFEFKDILALIGKVGSQSIMLRYDLKEDSDVLVSSVPELKHKPDYYPHNFNPYFETVYDSQLLPISDTEDPQNFNPYQDVTPHDDEDDGESAATTQNTNYQEVLAADIEQEQFSLHPYFEIFGKEEESMISDE